MKVKELVRRLEILDQEVDVLVDLKEYGFNNVIVVAETMIAGPNGTWEKYVSLSLDLLPGKMEGTIRPVD